MSRSEGEHAGSDLEFLDGDVEPCDATDGLSALVIALEKDSQIPPKYVSKKIFSPHLEPSYHYHPTEERILRRKKVLSSWGKEVHHQKSHLTKGILILLSLEGQTPSHCINEKTISKYLKAISKLSGSENVEAVKFSELQILIQLTNTNAYEQLGKHFMDGQIKDVDGFKLIEMQVVSVVAPHPCYLEMSCMATEGHQLQVELSSVLVLYCSRFSYLTIREPIQKASNDSSSSNSPVVKTRKLAKKANDDTIPAIGMVMMFTSRAQKNADNLQGTLNTSKNWKKVQMLTEITENDEVYYKYTASELLLSVKQASPFAGIKITVFVNENFHQMERFYTLITGKTPLAYNKIEEGLSFRTFSLSSKLELQLVLHPKLHSHNIQDMALCFPVNDMNDILPEIPGGMRNIGEDHWQVTDPDGNSVVLYRLLK